MISKPVFPHLARPGEHSRPAFFAWEGPMGPRLMMIGLLTLTVGGGVCGCGQAVPAGPTLSPPHPVHGKIAFPDKTPLKGGLIYFTPLDIHGSGGLRYEAAGLIDANGSYQLGFNGDNKGVPAGEYKVTIMPRDYQELQGSNSGKIPKSYQQQSSTPLQKVTVKEGDNELNFELK
jgi:hypothetical protein